MWEELENVTLDIVELGKMFKFPTSHSSYFLTFSDPRTDTVVAAGAWVPLSQFKVAG